MRKTKEYELPTIYAEKLVSGRSMDFYVGISKYRDELRIVLFTQNPKTKFIGGLFSMPIEVLPKLYEAIPRLLLEVEKEMRQEGGGARDDEKISAT